MSTENFSDQELAFFEEGDTLTDHILPQEDFSDLEEEQPDSGPSWISRALAILPIIGPARSES